MIEYNFKNEWWFQQHWKYFYEERVKNNQLKIELVLTNYELYEKSIYFPFYTKDNIEIILCCR